MADMTRIEAALDELLAEEIDAAGLPSDTCIRDIINEWSWDYTGEEGGAELRKAVYAAMRRVLERLM